MRTVFDVNLIEGPTTLKNNCKQLYSHLANPSSSIQMRKMFKKLKSRNRKLSDYSHNYKSLNHSNVSLPTSIHSTSLKARDTRNRSLQKQTVINNQTQLFKSCFLNKIQQIPHYRIIHQENKRKQLCLKNQKLQGIKTLSEACILGQSQQLQKFHNKPRFPICNIAQNENNLVNKSALIDATKRYRIKRRNLEANKYMYSSKISILFNQEELQKKEKPADVQNYDVQQTKNNFSQVHLTLKRKQSILRGLKRQESFKIEAWRESQPSIDTSQQLFA